MAPWSGCLTRLAMLTGEEGYRRRAEAIVETFSGELARNFFPLATLLNNVELLAKPLQIVIVGNSGDPALRGAAPRCLRRLLAEPDHLAPPAGKLAPGRSSGFRQGSRRRQAGRLCLRRPGLLTADHRPQDFARNSRPGALASSPLQNSRGMAMAYAIRFEKPGGPDVLSWQEVEVGKPGQGQVRLRHRAVGLNYIDTYHRSGLYSLPMPSGLGSEGGRRRRGGRTRGQRAEAGRPRRLCRRADRRLCRGAGHAGRPPRSGARRHHRPAGGGDDAEGHDRLVSRAPHPSGQTRRDDPDPCRGRRGRPHRLPMGKASRRHRDRHRRRSRKRRRSPSRTAAIIRSCTRTRISSPRSTS